MSDVERAMERAASDDAFRSRVMADAGAALKEYHLDPEEQAHVFQSVQMLSGEIQPEAVAQTEEELEEVEDGQEEAAGAKN